MQDPARARLPPLAAPGQPRRKSKVTLAVMETSSTQMRQVILGIPRLRASSDLCINNRYITIPQLHCGEEPVHVEKQMLEKTTHHHLDPSITIKRNVFLLTQISPAVHCSHKHPHQLTDLYFHTTPMSSSSSAGLSPEATWHSRFRQPKSRPSPGADPMAGWHQQSSVSPAFESSARFSSALRCLRYRVFCR